MKLLTQAEKRAFLTSRGSTKRGQHSFTCKICHWSYCSGCGLVLLRNEATARAARAQCEWEE